MTYVLIGLATAAGILTLVGVVTILRVTFGGLRWNSQVAFWAHVLYVSAGLPLTIGLISAAMQQ